MLQDTNVESDEGKKRRKYFILRLSVAVSAVQCHPRMASAPLLSPRNDVMYTHLMINMQPRSSEKRSEG